MLAPTRLRLIRVARGMTQIELAEKANVSQADVSAAERGLDAAGALKKIAKALGEKDHERLIERTGSLEFKEKPCHEKTAKAK